MRHYEIVLLFHPDQSEQVAVMSKRYKTMINESGGQVHRFEDWGRRQLAYPIGKIYKAHYILLNIECNQAVLTELNSAFRYNDAIIRSLVLNRKQAISSPSPIMQELTQKKPEKSGKESTSTVEPTIEKNDDVTE